MKTAGIWKIAVKNDLTGKEDTMYHLKGNVVPAVSRVLERVMDKTPFYQLPNKWIITVSYSEEGQEVS